MSPVPLVAWQRAQKNLRRRVLPRQHLLIGPPQAGQVQRVCTCQCFLSTNARIQARSSKLYPPVCAISWPGLRGGRSPARVAGCTRMRTSTSFLMMLPTPAKICRSSNASQANMPREALSLRRVRAGPQQSLITSARQSYTWSSGCSMNITEHA